MGEPGIVIVKYFLFKIRERRMMAAEQTLI